MIFSNLHKIIRTIAILLWLTALILVIVAASNHQFWSLTPLIAHNRPQNFLGWIITIAFIFTVCSPILKRIAESKS